MAQKKKNPEIKSDFISLKEAVKYCDYTQEYLSLRARQGKLKAVKFARNWLTKKEWIEEYIREMEEYERNQRNQRKQIEVKPKLEEKALFVKGISISLSRISFFPKLKPALSLALILLLLFTSIALGKESFKNILQDTIFYVQQTPKTINHVLKESKKSLASSLDSLNQSFINLAEVIKTTDYQDLKTPIPLFKEYFQWSVTNLKSIFVQKPKDLGRDILSYANRLSLKIVQGFKHQVLTFRKGGGRFVKQTKEGTLAFGQATKDLTLYIYNLALRTPEFLVRGVTEGIPTLAKKIVDFGSYTSNIFKKGWQFLVLEFQTQRKELKQFITRFWKRVPPKEPEKPVLVEVSKEEFEKLKQEIQRIKEEGLPVKEIEVSRITKVEPIKEITKEIKILDDESLKIIRATLSQQETDVEKLKLAASLGYVRFPTILPTSGDTTIITLGTISTGTWNGDVITTTYGGSGANLSSGAQGGIVYMGASSIMGISAAGTSGYALISGGTGVPTWTNTPSWSTLTLSSSITSPLYTGTGAVTLSSGGAGALTLDSASGTVRVIAGNTLQADTFTDGTLSINTGAITGGTTAEFSTSLTSPLLQTSANASTLTLNIPVTGADATPHTIYFNIDGNTGISIAATGDGAGAVGARTIVIGDATADVAITDANWSITGAGAGTLTSLDAGSGTIQTIGAGNFGTLTATTSVTSPIIYGSSAASGNLTLRSTSDVTKGYVILADDGGNVGIGTAGPTTKLEVVGTDYPVTRIVRSVSATNTAYTPFSIKTKTSSDMVDNFGVDFDFLIEDNAGVENPIALIRARRSGADNSGKLTFVTYNTGTQSEKVTILPGGNVGIGDTSPDYLLELYDATNTPTFALSDDDIAHGLTTLAETDVFAHLTSLSTTAGGAQLTVISDTNAQALSVRGVIGSTDPTDTTPAIKLIGAKSDGTTGMADLGADETVFQIANNDNTAALTILGDGAVGIGTTSPNEQLEITGNLRLPTTTATTGIIKAGSYRLIHNYGAVTNIFVGLNAGNLSMTGAYNTAMGYSALYSNTTGQYNTAIGTYTLNLNTTGSSNTAIGYDALDDNISGGNNVAMGRYALQTNTTGSSNIAIGYGTLYDNLANSYNTAVGYEALHENIANYNTAVGSQTLYKNTTGTYNVAMGPSALYYNTTGYRNTAVGYKTLRSNTTGYYNSAIGTEALYSNTTGTHNAAMGYRALYSNTTGTYNTAMGNYYTLSSNTTGTHNAAMGYYALKDNTTGSSNIAIGSQALYHTKPTSKAITAFADYGATVAGTVKATSVAHGLTGTVANVRISGTTNYNGVYSITVIDVDNFYFTDTWVSDDATGWWGIDTEGRYNTALGYQAGFNNITGSGNLFLGYQAGYNETGSDKLYIANSSGTPLIYGDFSSGNVGIGTTAPNVSGYTGKVLTIGAGATGLTSAVEIYGQRSGSDGSIGADLLFLNISATGSDKRVAIIRGLRLGDDDSGGLTFYSRNAGSFVNAATIQSDGNVGIGTAVPDSRTQITGGGLCVGSDANCNTDNNTEGYVYAAQTAMIVYDVAENYPTKDDTLTAAEVVSLDPDNAVFVRRSSSAYDSKLLGVISTEPAVLLGGFKTEQSQFKDEIQVPVTLSGRTPVKVSLENGPIEIGDYLTSSNIPGVAMKATEPGRVIGLALEGFDGIITQCEKETIEKDEKGKTEEIGNCQTIESETGKILVFVNPHWSLGSLAKDGSVATSDNNQQLIDNNETSSETLEEQPTILDQFTLAIKKSLEKLGLLIKDSIVKVKELVAEKMTAKKLCLEGDDGETICVDKNQLEELLMKNQTQNINTSSGSSGGSDGSTGGSAPDVCDATHLNLCTTQAECETAAGFWYNEGCNAEPGEPAEPEEPVCNSEHLDLCTTQELCEAANLYWYNETCNLEPETSACQPTEEVCDGIDNDCDELIDEDLGQTTCGVGACAVTINNCIDGQSQTCTPGTPTDEICDQIDNNCDGQIDEAGICETLPPGVK